MSVDMGSLVRIREPGLGQDWLGKERYVIKGGGVLALPIMVGDEIEVIDPEGLQSALLMAFDSSGRIVTTEFGIKAEGYGNEIAAMLEFASQGQANAAKIKAKLEAFGIDLTTSPTAQILSGQPDDPTRCDLISHSEAVCLICAPGQPMRVYEQHPPSDLVVYITRSNPSAIIANELPDPLADQSQDVRIDAATAVSYEVKAGEYIQIIDVDGRQCSDFQCFDAAKLDRGIERCLDATTTRALMGSAYPGPGLFSKFYDVDFEPVLEVVQDTCGRHDSFGLACTSKYYDEVGYPGHVNCSENFNYALTPYSVEPRMGWMAMNLFLGLLSAAILRPDRLLKRRAQQSDHSSSGTSANDSDER